MLHELEYSLTTHALRQTCWYIFVREKTIKFNQAQLEAHVLSGE